MKSAFRTRPLSWIALTTILSALIMSAGDSSSAQVPRREDPINENGSVEATVDLCVETAMSAYDIPGLAVAIVADGKIVFERGYGVKHRTRGGAVNEHTLFRPGSVDKMFTAAAILRLVDQGIVNLNDSVTEYVPELHFAPGRWDAERILVRHLIANTAAIPSFRSISDSTLSGWVSTLDEVPLLAEPGAFFNYSNSNFALADLVVERASGMAFSDYIAAEIYLPAGMRDSTRSGSEAMTSGNYSFGHADDGRIYAPDDYVHLFDGFLSAHDIARWAQIMMNGGDDVLSRKSAFMAQTPQVPMLFQASQPTSIGGGSYGFGLFVDEYPAGTIVSHTGGIPGWVANVAWVPTDNFAVVMMANSWEHAFGGVQEAVVCVLEGTIGFSTPDMSEPSDPSTWSPYAGTYEAVFEDGFEFEVVVEYEDGRLLMTAPDPADPSQEITRSLENVHASTFFFRPDESSWWPITFVPGKGNPAPVRWMRNQRFVGLKPGLPYRTTRRRLSCEGG